MTKEEKKKLAIAACKIRMGAVDSVYHAKSGHPGGSLSAADLLSFLYFQELNIDPENPKWADRDRFVLSKGHCAPALYSALALRGYFDIAQLEQLRKVGAMLQGHPDMKNIPGVDMSTGSLGQGVSTACGMALSAKLSNQNYRVFAILGDGELEEGQVWEAAMFASHKKLDNLCIFIDYNGLQIDGMLSEVCSPEPIPEKYAAFGFDTVVIDGHSFEEIESAVERFHRNMEQKTGRPTAIIAKTVKGKGVSYMENVAAWHGAAPNEEQHKVAMEELKAQLEQLERA